MNDVLIRPLKVSDAETSWTWRNDLDVWKYTGSKPDKYITYETEDSWIKHALKQQNATRFAILVNDVYVGNIQLTSITEFDAEYHIFIGDKNYWGKGITPLATNQILRYAKHVLNLKKVYLNVNPQNTAAIKAYEKCNFVRVNENIKMEVDLLNISLPIVSVFMMVYNHENYISEALNGILMQKCNFDFDIVVGEDCSTDNSRKILLDCATKFPGKFKLLLSDENIGANKNQQLVLQNCTGKYIAMCEGDDYWVDPFKLQKQVDFLEINPDFLFSMGRVDILDQKNGEIRRKVEYVDPSKKETYTLKDYIKKPFSQTSSFVFRNSDEPFPDWLSNVHAGDQSLVVIKTGIKGKIKYHNDLFSIYRLNENSITFTVDLKKIKIKASFFLNKINEFTEYKYNRIILIRLFMIKLYCYSRDSNFIIKYPSIIAYRMLLNLIQIF